MEKDIMWLYVWQNDGRYLCATRIQSGVQCEILQEYPIWKIPKEIILHASYFDGQRFFVAKTYYQLFSINQQGEMYNCNPGELHGQCEKFIVLGNYLYADTNAQDIDSCFRIDAYNRIPKISQKVWFDRYK